VYSCTASAKSLATSMGDISSSSSAMSGAGKSAQGTIAERIIG
jgi:hypothetical protein